MEYKDIRELALLMRETGLTSLEFESGDDSIKLRRENKPTAAVTASSIAVAALPLDDPPFDTAQPVESYDSGDFTVKSPMVGVFYSAAGADLEPYVTVGDEVQVGDVLCIIEAMKIMNEITAERNGVITEICTQNRQIVEFGQPLFRIGSVKPTTSSSEIVL